MTATTNTTKPVAPSSVAPLAADLDAALRRLRAGRGAPHRRRSATGVAKTQRWTPERSCGHWSRPRSPPAMPPTPPTASRPPRSPSPRPSTGSTSAGSSVHPGHAQLPIESGMDSGATEPGCHRPTRHGQESPAHRLRARRRPRGFQGPLLHRRRPHRGALPRPGRQHRRQDHRHPAASRPGDLATRSASPRSMTPAPNCCSGSWPPATSADPWPSPRTGPSKKRTCSRERVHSAAETSRVRDSP